MKKLLALGLLMVGSANAQSANVIDLSSSSDQRIESLEQRLVHKGKITLEMQQHIDTLQQELNELRGFNETHEYRLNQILQRQRELYQEFDKLLTKVKNLEESPEVDSDNAITSVSPVDVSLSESGAYQQALNLALKNKKFDEAILKFKQYQITYPDSSYIPNVHYWLGQLLFNKGNKVEAQKEFELLVANFSESTKRGDALVKLGKIAQDDNQLDKARDLYKQVVKEYVNSSAAQIAKTRLTGLR